LKVSEGGLSVINVRFAGDPDCWANPLEGRPRLLKPIITTVLVSLIGTVLGAAPRIIVSLAKGAGGKVTVRVENAGPQVTALFATTYVTLLKAESPERHRPLYWARLAAHGVPTRSQALRLTRRGTSTAEVDPSSLSWSRDRNGVSGEPLRRIVPPGDYELQIQIVDEEGQWWRSGELLVSVSSTGELRF
jgi:hypothetical protein